jgi:hypothetical protein
MTKQRRELNADETAFLRRVQQGGHVPVDSIFVAEVLETRGLATLHNQYNPKTGRWDQIYTAVATKKGREYQ